MKLIKYFWLVIAVIGSDSALAYRQPLHTMMTTFSAQKSVLGNNQIWADWNESPSRAYPFQPTKVDIKVHQSIGVAQKPIFLMGYGADSEDTSEGVAVSRAFNHFFNPQANLKLNVPFAENYASPDWTLEGVLFSSSEVSISTQDYSYSDAQYYFYRAFSSPQLTVRNINFGKMFQTLGNVVHHVQDMAQPEHTRLDAHCDALACDLTSNALKDDKSLYEELTDEMVSCNVFTTNPAEQDAPVTCGRLRSWSGGWNTNKIYLGSYPVPTGFAGGLPSTPRDFWTTPDLRGLADFSSRNFISTDTAYRLKAYTPGATFIDMLLPAKDELPFPSGDAADTYIHSESLSTLLPNIGSTPLAKYKDYQMKFIGLRAKDNQLPLPLSTVNMSRMATISMFTERLIPKSTRAGELTTITVNNFNLEQRAKEMVPRAVGYSTGLINYFFRHRMKVTEVPVSGQRSRWRVQNISSYDFNGCLEFYYDAGTELSRTKVDSCRDVHIPAGSSITTNSLVVDASKNPESTFYMIALESTGDSARPWVAVAATSFQNANTIPVLCEGWSYTKYDGYPPDWKPLVNRFNLGDVKGTVTVTLGSITLVSSAHYHFLVTKIGDYPNPSFLWTGGYDNTGFVGWFTFPIEFGLVHEGKSKTYTFEYDPASFPEHAVQFWVVYNSSNHSHPILDAMISCPSD